MFVILAWLLAGCLIGRERLAFRDVGHFYTPLYGYLAERERAEWLPLHNPLDELGVPLIGETTTAIFYPPRRLIFRWCGSPESALAWYVFSHLLLAGGAAGYAARRAGAGRVGCGLATLTYPLSGPVLFLYCNPPYLVGAAWMPLALAGGLGLAARWSFRDLVLTSVALAMMVLGGDPQTAVHVLLIGTAVAAVATLRQGPRAGAATWGRLAAGLGLAGLLSLPQLIGSADWARQSDRYTTAGAGSVGEVYDFSVAPWHWVETVLPYASGRLFPTHTRVSRAIADDGRTWTVTLYAGLIPLALMLLRYRDRWAGRGRACDAWDSLLPLAVLGSLGSFGCGYLLRSLNPGTADLSGWPFGSDLAGTELSGPAADAVGGLWWWLATWVPGYSGFRYPAKWLIFAPLGIAIAAARQADRRGVDGGRSLVALLTGLVAFATVLAIVIVVTTGGLFGQSRWAPPPDSIWGPFDQPGATTMIAASLLGVAAIAAAATVWIRYTATRNSLRRRHHGTALVLLLGIDLAIVGRPLIGTVERAAETSWLGILADHTGTAGPGADVTATFAQLPLRVVRSSPTGWPASWQHTASSGAGRMLAAEVAMRTSRFGRWHLADGVAIFNPLRSLASGRVVAFWRAANAEAQGLSGTERIAHWDRLFGWLAVDRVWHERQVARTNQASFAPSSDGTTASGQAASAGGVAKTADEATELRQLRAWAREFRQRDLDGASPRVVWFGRWQEITPANRLTDDRFRERLREVVGDPSGSASPLLETTRPAAPPFRGRSAREGDDDADGASLTVLDTGPDRWRVRVEADRAGLLCWKWFQDGNLRAVARPIIDGDIGAPQSLPVRRCDYLFSAVELPSGQFDIELTYRPNWLIPALSIWFASWAGLLAIAVGRHWGKPAGPRIWRSNASDI
ncbi:MAG: hypothetical protein EA381_17065 [Planctomycetaceae bacterium]|nr:MAG: hypothetical protein EA381_17065 [Planctomycetaceae bacterium]